MMSTHHRLELMKPSGTARMQVPVGANSSVNDIDNASCGAVSGIGTRSVAATGTTSDPMDGQSTLFEQEVLVLMKHMDREEVAQPLQISVSTGRAGPHNISRCVTLRITDPRDPFFLFVMTLLEDEYGRFKDEHELNVDFAGFPRYLVSMLISAVEGQQFTVTFVVQDTGRGILRILERTEFRSVEHMKLMFTRQGDEGQKKYLAERFYHFQAAYQKSETDRAKSEASLNQLTDELRHDIELLTNERDEVRQQLKLESSTAQTSRLGELGALKEQHHTEIQAIRSAAEEERNKVVTSYSNMVHEEEAKRREAQTELATTSSRLQASTAESSLLAERLGRSTEAETRLRQQVDELRTAVDELSLFKRTATQKMTDNELQSVATGERLRHYGENLKERDEELKNLREQVRQNDHYVRMLTEQLESAQTSQKETDGGLTKAHHIIKSLLAKADVFKQKIEALQAQLQAREDTIREKDTTIERLKNESRNLQERLDLSQSKGVELKDQLMKSEETSQTLAAQLRQNEQALLHINRQTSAIGQRSWPMLGTASYSPSASVGASSQPTTAHISAASSFLTGPANLHREFAKGMSSGASPSLGAMGDRPPSGSSPSGRLAGGGLGAPAFLSGTGTSAASLDPLPKHTTAAATQQAEAPSAYFPSA